MPLTTSGIEFVDVDSMVATALAKGEVVPMPSWVVPVLIAKELAESNVVAAE